MPCLSHLKQRARDQPQSVFLPGEPRTFRVESLVLAPRLSFSSLLWQLCQFPGSLSSPLPYDPPSWKGLLNPWISQGHPPFLSASFSLLHPPESAPRGLPAPTYAAQIRNRPRDPRAHIWEDLVALWSCLPLLAGKPSCPHWWCCTGCWSRHKGSPPLSSPRQLTAHLGGAAASPPPSLPPPTPAPQPASLPGWCAQPGLPGDCGQQCFSFLGLSFPTDTVGRLDPSSLWGPFQLSPMIL